MINSVSIKFWGTLIFFDFNLGERTVKLRGGSKYTVTKRCLISDEESLGNVNKGQTKELQRKSQ